MAESKLKSSIMKSLDMITESLKSLENRVKALEEPPAVVEEEEEVVVEEKSKENAKIEGIQDAGSPDDANPEVSNETYLFKSLAKKIEALEKSMNTQKSASPRTADATVNKATTNAVDVALGKTKLRKSEVHKAAKQAWR